MKTLMNTKELVEEMESKVREDFFTRRRIIGGEYGEYVSFPVEPRGRILVDDVPSLGQQMHGILREESGFTHWNTTEVIWYAELPWKPYGMASHYYAAVTRSGSLYEVALRA